MFKSILPWRVGILPIKAIEKYKQILTLGSIILLTGNS